MDTSLNRLIEFYLNNTINLPLISTDFGISYPQNGERIVTRRSIQIKLNFLCSKHITFKCSKWLMSWWAGPTRLKRALTATLTAFPWRHFTMCILFCAGIFFVLPCIDTYTKVDLRTVSFDVPPQEVRSDFSRLSSPPLAAHCASRACVLPLFRIYFFYFFHDSVRPIFRPTSPRPILAEFAVGKLWL